MSETTGGLYDAYERRYWGALAQRTRRNGIEFVLGRREGPFIWERESGRRILDCGLTGGVHSLGHRHPEILGALQKALDTGLDSGIWHFPTHEMLAFQDRLTALAPHRALDRAVITLGSTASIDLAVQFAVRMTGRPHVVAYRHGYHGHAGFAAQVTGSESEGIAEHYGVPNRTGRFFQSYGRLDSLADVMNEQVAAVILEPFDYETFAAPPADYLLGVQAICRKHGALLILDETRTGLRRAGPVWMAELSGVTPDILISGKGLGGGLYPVSALLTRRDIYDSCINGHDYGFASSMAGNEIACMVGNKVLDVVARPETAAALAALSARFTANFERLVVDFGEVYSGARITGGIVTLGLRDTAVAESIFTDLFRQGVLCHSVSTIEPQTIKFFPVLLAEPAIADIVAEALEAVARATLGRKMTVPS